MTTLFRDAQPVWLPGRETEMNLFVGFRAAGRGAPRHRATLRLTASTVYRAFVNGRFAGYGPARGPHGWFRVDEWDVTTLLDKPRNIIAIEVAGYNSNGFAAIDQPSFLQAELDVDGRILAATGRGRDFRAFVLGERVQKVQRFNIMRTFAEVYRLTPDHDDWRTGGARRAAPLHILPRVALLQRHVAAPDFARRQPATILERGRLSPYTPEREVIDRAWLWAGTPKLKSFSAAELSDTTFLELQRLRNTGQTALRQPYTPDTSIRIRKGEYQLVDFGANLTGFPGLEVTCRKTTRLVLHFDELLTQGDVRFRDSEGVNAIVYVLEPGTYRLEAFEPYTFRYLKLLCTAGLCRITSLHLRRYGNSAAETASFMSSDDRMNAVFEAARETFRQNALDVFMDCPGRERGGYLCDAFFTARASFALTGNTQVEDNFFENYQLPPSFKHLPEGMVAMCYPADHYDGLFIPNWGLWLIVQLEEYAQRGGRPDLIAGLRPRVEALLRYFEPFLNADGLLEKLAGWVFVEWSDSNQYLQDVSFASNALYAGALSAAGRLYGERRWLRQAAAVRRTIRRQAFDGTYFCDNAVRGPDGVLRRTGHHTETCQYYLFFFDVATPASHPALWKALCEDFGAARDAKQLHPDVPPSNAFIGLMLRAELLSRYGEGRRMLRETVDCWSGMAAQTGTLWEHVSPSASCCHGFTAHVAYTFYRDVLGIRRIDPVNRIVELRQTDTTLAWCRGRIPVGDGFVEVAWRHEDGTLRRTCNVPAGYTICQSDRKARAATCRSGTGSTLSMRSRCRVLAP